LFLASVVVVASLLVIAVLGSKVTVESRASAFASQMATEIDRLNHTSLTEILRQRDLLVEIEQAITLLDEDRLLKRVENLSEERASWSFYDFEGDLLAGNGGFGDEKLSTKIREELQQTPEWAIFQTCGQAICRDRVARVGSVDDALGYVRRTERMDWSVIDETLAQEMFARRGDVTLKRVASSANQGAFSAANSTRATVAFSLFSGSFLADIDLIPISENLVIQIKATSHMQNHFAMPIYLIGSILLLFGFGLCLAFFRWGYGREAREQLASQRQNATETLTEVQSRLDKALAYTSRVEKKFSMTLSILAIEKAEFYAFFARVERVRVIAEKKLAPGSKPKDLKKALSQVLHDIHTIRILATNLKLRYVQYAAKKVEDGLLDLLKSTAPLGDQSLAKTYNLAIEMFDEVRAYQQTRSKAIRDDMWSSRYLDLRGLQQHWLKSLTGRLFSLFKDPNRAAGNVEDLFGEFRRALNYIDKVDLHQFLTRVNQDAQAVASRLKKRIYPIELTGNARFLDPSVNDHIAVMIIHAVRNAIDHGIETPEVRKNRGKDPVGRITLQCSTVMDQLFLIVEDDGQGLREEWVKLRLDCDDPFEKLVHSGISTATTVDDFSGQGLGLSIIDDEARELGGQVRALPSADNVGFRLEVSFPMPGSRFAGQESVFDLGVVVGQVCQRFAKLLDRHQAAVSLEPSLIDAGLMQTDRLRLVSFLKDAIYGVTLHCSNRVTLAIAWDAQSKQVCLSFSDAESLRQLTAQGTLARLQGSVAGSIFGVEMCESERCIRLQLPADCLIAALPRDIRVGVCLQEDELSSGQSLIESYERSIFASHVFAVETLRPDAAYDVVIIDFDYWQNLYDAKQLDHHCDNVLVVCNDVTRLASEDVFRLCEDPWIIDKPLEMASIIQALEAATNDVLREAADTESVRLTA
jgi:signal transduction histidine kinase